MASAQVSHFHTFIFLINLANSSEPQALLDRFNRQASYSQNEVGHGIQGSANCLRWLHEPLFAQYRGMD